MATAEERHIQLVRQTAVEVLECLGAPPGPDPPDARARGARPGAAAGLLPALAAGRPRDELLRQFSELSRLLKGRQGTSSHEEPETSLWTQSALDQYALEPREVRADATGRRHLPAPPPHRRRRPQVPPNEHPGSAALRVPGTRLGAPEPTTHTDTHTHTHTHALPTAQRLSLWWGAVPELLLTKLLPEMEPQPRADAPADAPAPADARRRVAELEQRVRDYNALCAEALQAID